MTATTETTTAKRETYAEMKARQSKDWNEFPLFAAFNNEQFKRGMEKLGVSSPSELYKMGRTGCFYRKTDAARLHELMDRHEREMEEAMKDRAFAVGAFVDELGNHEFCITHDPTDTLAALGYTYRQKRDADGWTVSDWEATFEGDKMLVSAFNEALRQYAQGMKKYGF